MYIIKLVCGFFFFFLVFVFWKLSLCFSFFFILFFLFTFIALCLIVAKIVESGIYDLDFDVRGSFETVQAAVQAHFTGKEVQGESCPFTCSMQLRNVQHTEVRLPMIMFLDVEFNTAVRQPDDNIAFSFLGINHR